MELSDYELIRYPSGQLVITRVALTASGAPSSGPRDVIGAFTDEQEAQSVLDRLAGGMSPQRPGDAPPSAPGG
jgi:hypothetical protein